MRIDAHQHYWKISRNDYGWITPEVPTLYRDFLEENLIPHLQKHKIDKTIVIQAAPTIEETEFILSQSENSEVIAGVVGWIDIEDPSYKRQLELFLDHPKFVGIRVMIQDMPDAKVILKRKYIDAFHHFGELDLPVDLLVHSNQLSAVVKLLDQVTIRGVIDHIAKPVIKEGTTEPWRSHMTEIAKHPAIYCKLSGMVTESDHTQWKLEDFIPYVQHIVKVFGLDRLLYGSDWPVCLLAASYDEVIQIIEKVLPENLTESDKVRIFGENAKTFYKLDV
ncbi:amidohydrolase family protein [Gracilibacillus caseinilyticus]|uniref:Amidohydrolase family protein n=1 Tax=Gracilibacillus caseinilyticus TaxID=2932256 RepID=A0ABY4ERB4_9BACI|nr:amidohydrolase family protein [Gracilibacillus caseinilyticus]UOQ46973.1 amidohydrolase family protein [Gracilibacillus caseinilyticus]